MNDGHEDEAGDDLVIRLMVGVCVDIMEIYVLGSGCLLYAIE